MSKWIDDEGFARADKEDCEGGYTPIICFNCEGDGCAECDGDGVVVARPYAREEGNESECKAEKAQS